MNEEDPLNSFLQARNLTQRFRVGESHLTVFENISLNVERGEMVAVTGESGAGKSTLLYLLGGLEPPTSGEIIVDGQMVHNASLGQSAEFRNREIGFVFQFHYLLPEFSAVENVCIPRWIGGRTDVSTTADARQYLEEVGLKERLSHRVGQLSGGEQQRVALARALINQPKLLLADEPTGNLDYQTSAGIMALLRRLHQQHQLTSVIATHSAEVAREADRVVCIQEGRLFEVDKNTFAR